MHDSVCSIGTVAVGNVRSDAPTVDDVVASGETSVTGDSTEEGGAIVDVYVNGIYRGWSTVRNNRFLVENLPPFFGGQEIWATVTNTPLSEYESERSPSVFVSVYSVCNDGLDNDNDTLVDFPADPGCDSALDNSKVDTDVPEYSDFQDNEPDGFTDFSDDLGC